jgi:signal transduction histidine kinase
MQTTDPKAEWLNAVAHDLKTPINSVRGCIELVQQLGPLNERQRYFSDRAMVGLQRMEHLVARLLDISWIDADMPLDLAETDLKSVVQEAVDLLREAAESRHITVQARVHGLVKPVLLDRLRISQVLDNLISNAIKYNRDGGKVWISIAQDRDTVVVSVKDTGMGIAPADQGRVFERFFRSREGVARKIEGSGLGLAITRAIILKHQGRIWFETEPGESTTFFFSLPARAGRGESRDGTGEVVRYVGEGEDPRAHTRAELSSEERDPVDDNMQEKREIPEFDSTGDDI